MKLPDHYPTSGEYLLEPLEGPDGRLYSIIPLTFGRARIVVGRDRLTYDDGW
jgi:hypothetical protein